MRLRIITDSSTSVPQDYLDRLSILEVPAWVNFGDQSYLKTDLTPQEFYRTLEQSDRLPTTSQPTPGQFLQAYQRAAAEGAQEIIAVCVTGKLSGTLASAVLAAEDAPVKVHIWDTQHVTIAAGWQAIAAAEMVQAGLSSEEILARLASIRGSMFIAITPANLRFLIASGRVPRLRGAVGDLLSIRPIITAEDGGLEPTGQVRGQRRSLELMLDRAAAAAGDHPVRLAVGHCNAEDIASGYLRTARERLQVRDAIFFDAAPVLAALIGPGALGIALYPVEESV
jgi:DegV family protein with EDD domain